LSEKKNDSLTINKNEIKRKRALRLIEQWLDEIEKNNELKKKNE